MRHLHKLHFRLAILIIINYTEFGIHFNVKISSVKNLFWIGYLPENGRGRGPGRPIHTWKHTIPLNDLKLDNTYEYDELYTKAQDRDNWSFCVVLCASRHRRN